MSSTYVVIKNSRQIVARVDTRKEARQIALEMLSKHPRAAFESGKIDRKVTVTIIPEVREVVEVDL
jgi:hypothetical protein